MKKYCVYFGVSIYLMISLSKFRRVDSFKLAYRILLCQPNQGIIIITIEQHFAITKIMKTARNDV